MESDFLSQHVPHYLLSGHREGFIRALQDFEVSKPFYVSGFIDEVLQGDGWTSLPIVNEISLTKKMVRGLIISNSCDIDEENKRIIPARVTFVPIVRLSGIKGIFVKAGLSEKDASIRLDEIRNQKITDMFYIPKWNSESGDWVALFQEARSIDAKPYYAQPGRRKLFTLSQFGHYLLLFKLSIHYCRFNEGVIRS